MKNSIEKEFQQILLEVPELTHIFPEIEHQLRNDLDEKNKPKSAKKILEDIIDKNANKVKSKESGAKLNFYPSPLEYGDCEELCIGIATKGYGYKKDDNNKRTGFTGLINDIVEYWITCGVKNKRTILFTTEWRYDDFNKKWKGKVDRYKENGKEVLIFEVYEVENIVKYIKRYS
jgi:hypothetical protein